MFVATYGKYTLVLNMVINIIWLVTCCSWLLKSITLSKSKWFGYRGPNNLTKLTNAILRKSRAALKPHKYD
jgi:hypothetical protein